MPFGSHQPQTPVVAGPWSCAESASHSSLPCDRGRTRHPHGCPHLRANQRPSTQPLSGGSLKNRRAAQRNKDLVVQRFSSTAERDAALVMIEGIEGDHQV